MQSPNSDPQPDVSYIMAAHNAAPFVAAALRSALAQEDVTIEVVVVDDGSTDGTAGVAAEMAAADPRISLLQTRSKSGPSAARNLAMRAARGRWIAILDADDLITPRRSRALLDLAAATSADIVADNFERFWTDGEPSGVTMLPRQEVPYALAVDLAMFMRGNQMFHPQARLGYVKPMFRTDFMRSNGIAHQEDIVIGEDYHLCVSALMAGGRFFITSETFYQYRTRSGSLSWRIDKNHIDRLLAAHHDLRLQERFGGDQELLDAAKEYGGALERAAALSTVIQTAKNGHWAGALKSVTGQPRLWPLVTRVAAAAMMSRLTRTSRAGARP
jgi:succinoglycan biosynthesis protein ExoO